MLACGYQKMLKFCEVKPKEILQKPAEYLVPQSHSQTLARANATWEFVFLLRKLRTIEKSIGFAGYGACSPTSTVLYTVHGYP